MLQTVGFWNYQTNPQVAYIITWFVQKRKVSDKWKQRNRTMQGKTMKAVFHPVHNAGNHNSLY